MSVEMSEIKLFMVHCILFTFTIRLYQHISGLKYVVNHFICSYFQVLRLASIGGLNLQKGVVNMLTQLMSVEAMTSLNML